MGSSGSLRGSGAVADPPAGWAVRGLRRSGMAHIPRGPQPGSWTACCAMPPSGSCACSRSPYCACHSASSTPSPPSRLPPPPLATCQHHHTQGVRLQITKQPPAIDGCDHDELTGSCCGGITCRQGTSHARQRLTVYTPGSAGSAARLDYTINAPSRCARSPVINASSIARSASQHRRRPSSTYA